MAVFRIHRKEWEKGFRPLGAGASKKRKRSESDTQEELTPPGEGRKGVSSGLSTIVKRTPQMRTKAVVKAPSSSWWTTLETSSTTRKGSMKM
jgi:RNA exonuclease 4